MHRPVDAGAFLCRPVPRGGTGEIAGPERPASTLAGPNRIYPAKGCAAILFEEYAISGFGILDDCAAQAHFFQIAVAELLDGKVQKISDNFDFRSGNPDMPGGGSGAAPAALETFEVQPRCVPR